MSVPAMLLPPSSKLGKDIDAFSDIGLLKVVCVLRYVDGKVTEGESRSGRCRLRDQREGGRE